MQDSYNVYILIDFIAKNVRKLTDEQITKFNRLCSKVKNGNVTENEFKKFADECGLTAWRDLNL